MQYKVTYPKITGAESIEGWVSKSGVHINIEVGETIKVDQDIAQLLKQTYKFLDIAEDTTEEIIEGKQKIVHVDVTTEEVKQVPVVNEEKVVVTTTPLDINVEKLKKLDLDTLTWPQILKLGKSLGLTSKGKKREEFVMEITAKIESLQ